MNDRFIFCGPSGSGKSSAALGFMQSPDKTLIIQDRASGGFRYLRHIPGINIIDVGNFAEFADALEHMPGKSLVIIDDFDYLFRAQTSAARRTAQTSNAKRLAVGSVYESEEACIKALLESGATVIFTIKAVAQSRDKEGNKYVTEHLPFLPGLHAHMETGLVDGVFHFEKRGNAFYCHTVAREIITNESITRWYAKATIGLGEFLPKEIKLDKPAGKLAVPSVKTAVEKAKADLVKAWGGKTAESPAPDPAPEQAQLPVGGEQ